MRDRIDQVNKKYPKPETASQALETVADKINQSIESLRASIEPPVNTAREKLLQSRQA